MRGHDSIFDEYCVSSLPHSKFVWENVDKQYIVNSSEIRCEGELLEQGIGPEESNGLHYYVATNNLLLKYSVPHLVTLIVKYEPASHKVSTASVSAPYEARDQEISGPWILPIRAGPDVQLLRSHGKRAREMVQQVKKLTPSFAATF